MRDGILLSSLLNNSETWINLTQKNVLELEKPDKMLQEKLFQTNASKVFYYLELGILPAKYVMMKKRLTFMKYILDEPRETLIRKVFEEQRNDSRKEDFINLIEDDLKLSKIQSVYNKFEQFSKSAWNKLINKKTEEVAFQNLLSENKTKSKTKSLLYEKFEMSPYLVENSNTKVSKIIYSIRAGTLDLKYWNPWKYEDNLCVMCSIKEENIEHFMNCNAYERMNIPWEDIYKNDQVKLVKIGKEAMLRMDLREKKKTEDGQTSSLVPPTPDRPLFVCRVLEE